MGKIKPFRPTHPRGCRPTLQQAETRYTSICTAWAGAATRAHFGEPPELGMITFIDAKKVKPTKVHGRDTWGYTYIKAGFKPVDCGSTKRSESS